jgi:hypothetical protein
MARPRTGRNGSPTNIYLDQEVKRDGAKVAKERYGFSLSELVEELLRKEVALKRGLLPARSS